MSGDCCGGISMAPSLHLVQLRLFFMLLLSNFPVLQPLGRAFWPLSPGVLRPLVKVI